MEQYLIHHGIKGQKWGVRRYQNEDGSLTEAGRRRLEQYRSRSNARLDRKYNKDIERASNYTAKRKDIYTKLSNEGASEKKLSKAERRIYKAEFEEAMLRGREAVERKAVMSATLEDISKEHKAEALAVVGSLLTTVGSMGLVATGISPIGIISIPNVSAAREEQRRSRLGEQSAQDYYNKEREEYKRKWNSR